MIDIEIDNTGDFVLRERFKFPSLKLSWTINKTEALKLSFDVGRNMNDPPENIGLKLNLKIRNKIDTDVYSTVRKERELRQRILVLLRTELGELINAPNYGTKLIQQKHRDITDESVIKEVHDIVFDAVSDHLNEPRVIIRRKKNDTPFACQNLNVYIYNGRKEIYDFELGGI